MSAVLTIKNANSGDKTHQTALAVGTGVPAATDALVTNTGLYPIGSTYFDYVNNISYKRVAAAVAATDWVTGGPIGVVRKKISFGSSTTGNPGDDIYLGVGANKTAAHNDLGAIIPPFAQVLNVVARCTQAFAAGLTAETANAILVGNVSGGNQYIASGTGSNSGNLLAVNDVMYVATGAGLAVAPSATASHVWVDYTPSTNNYSALTSGEIEVTVIYLNQQ